TSVLRPGTALMCCGFTSTLVRPSSNRLNTGCQNTPVLSRATTWTRSVSNQSESTNRSAVIVEKVRTSRWSVPSGWVISTPATTVFVWTSSPAQRRSDDLHRLLPLSWDWAGTGCGTYTSFSLVLTSAEAATRIVSWTHPGQLPDAGSRHRQLTDLGVPASLE